MYGFCEALVELFSQSHLDVTGRANILTDVATDTLVVVGIDVTTHGGLIFLHAEDSVLRAVDNAVVAFEAHATAPLDAWALT